MIVEDINSTVFFSLIELIKTTTAIVKPILNNKAKQNNNINILNGNITYLLNYF